MKEKTEEQKRLDEERKAKKDNEKKEILEVFVKRMKGLRKERKEEEEKKNKNFSKKTASDGIGISESSLRKYESSYEKRLPSIVELKRIKDYYGVPYEYLLEESGKKKPLNDEQAIKNQEAIDKIKKILYDLES